MAIDILIPLGNGSFMQDIELRYCLRSIEANLKGYRDIYIIGHKPDWCINVIHIPMDDSYSSNKSANIISKIIRGCLESSLSKSFVRMSDDNYFLKPIHAKKLRPVYNEILSNKVNWDGSPWHRALKRTLNFLKKKRRLGYEPIYNYEPHVPMLVDKRLFPKIMIETDFGANPGYVANSIYYNSLMIKRNKVDVSDRVACMHMDKPLDIKNQTFLCNNDAGLSYELIEFLKRKFPNESKYEKKEASSAK